jgi:hypothetical protein
MFAFPLAVGAIRAGTTARQPVARDRPAAPDLAAHRAEIDQATGMRTLKLGVAAAETSARLRA